MPTDRTNMVSVTVFDGPRQWQTYRNSKVGWSHQVAAGASTLLPSCSGHSHSQSKSCDYLKHCWALELLDRSRWRRVLFIFGLPTAAKTWAWPIVCWIRWELGCWPLSNSPNRPSAHSHQCPLLQCSPPLHSRLATTPSCYFILFDVLISF